MWCEWMNENIKSKKEKKGQKRLGPNIIQLKVRAKITVYLDLNI